MKLLIQRVTGARVEVEGEVVGSIDQGLLALVGIEPQDDQASLARALHKLLNYRVFSDEAGKMNRSLKDTGGAALVVSQFTLAADLRGNRPGFSTAAPPAEGERLYKHFSQALEKEGVPVANGQFGADMAVSLVNDGPVTIWMDTDDL